MVTSRAAGVTAAAGTGLTQPLFPELFTLSKSLPPKETGTRTPLVTLSRIAKVSRLVRPVGPGILSQIPTPGFRSHDPYPS
jgi:hypothetical protein